MEAGTKLYKVSHDGKLYSVTFEKEILTAEGGGKLFLVRDGVGLRSVPVDYYKTTVQAAWDEHDIAAAKNRIQECQEKLDKLPYEVRVGKRT